MIDDIGGARAVSVAIALIAIASLPAPAEACSCGGEADVLPRNRADDVPLDALVVFVTRVVADPFGNAPEVEVRVVGTEELVPAAVVTRSRGDFGTYLIVLTPDAPLEPHTTYEVRHSPQIEPFTTFTTGDRVIGTEAAPDFGGLESFAAEAMLVEADGSTCVVRRDGLYHRLRIEHGGAGEDVAYLILELERPEEPDWSDFVPLATPYELTLATIESYLCGRRPPAVESGATYCARLVAFDVAGNQSGGESTLCAEVALCANAVDEDGWPADSCDPVLEPEPGPEERGCGCRLDGGAGGGPAAVLLAALALALAGRRRSGDSAHHDAVGPDDRRRRPLRAARVTHEVRRRFRVR